MGYPYTESGYNMFDMLSMIQKAIRRGDYEHAGFAAKQLSGTYRTTMWNRLTVISSEDCYGVLTKEIMSLRRKDEKEKSDVHLQDALALMCSAKKSRDACYFSCNFIMASRKPRNINPSEREIAELWRRTRAASEQAFDTFGFSQVSIFDEQGASQEALELASLKDEEREEATAGACLQVALAHLDMDMLGYEMDLLRRVNRDFLWDVLIDYAENCDTPAIAREIKALRLADDVVNQRKKMLMKDEIFISKAAMILCYETDGNIEDVRASDLIELEHEIAWSKIVTKPLVQCRLKDGKIPDYTYDCHTIRGKKMGKTDWDMTTTEQAALYPLYRAYFDDASWIYTYEQDLENNAISPEGIRPIREFAKTHPANPVKFIPYD